ncbi:MAG: aspartate--tRNA(Asn) ligase [Candidatus Odinarchaeia archaeon]
MERTHLSCDINPTKDGEKTQLLGWVDVKRDLGKIKFIILRDYKGKLQVTLPPNTSKEVVDVFNKINREDVIEVKGYIKSMPKAPNGAEVIPEEINIMNKAIAPLPIETSGRVSADLDTRLDNRILDLRRPKTNAIFKIRNKVLQSIREFFNKNDFIEINTPKIIASATEGGTELFPVAYFDKEAFLAQSPQLYKEQLTSVFEKVYEIAPVFRAEESNTTRHLAELIMVDFEIAFSDYIKVMNITEALLDHVFNKVNVDCQNELQLLNADFKVPETPYPRYTYDEIIKLLSKKGIEISWGEDLNTIAIRKLGEEIKGPYFITDWPTAEKPFYVNPKKDNPNICESFDLMYSWLELASGATRIHEKNTLIEQIKNKGMRPESFDFHLKVFDWGMPPHAGCGIGLARLIMIITGEENIRETVLFPRDKNRLTP